MPKRYSLVFGAVCAVTAAGTTGYCAFEVGPPGRVLQHQGIEAPSVLHPFPVETDPPMPPGADYAPD